MFKLHAWSWGLMSTGFAFFALGFAKLGMDYHALTALLCSAEANALCWIAHRRKEPL